MNKHPLSIRYAGSFARIRNKSSSNYKYPIETLSTGINFTDEHIIKVKQGKTIEWVVSRICDHASGSLDPCADINTAECPLHGWKLDLEKLQYKNVNVNKKTLNFDIVDNTIIVDEYDTHLQLPDELYQQQSYETLDIRFLAHACLLFQCGDLKIISDPWLKGPCFSNGWWHKPAPSDDSLEQLFSADLIYISHNHPDHMHEETLNLILDQRPDVPIIVPSFKTKSTLVPLEHMGFTNVKPLAFNQIYQINEQCYVSILKSGDFRDDSGLYISYGKKQALITVDSSALNHYHLPTNIDLLATSFAAGASGHPWCFDHYDHDKKLNIAKNRHKSVQLSILKYIDACKPKTYLPYAGYFSEDAPRDHYIKTNNNKNTPDIIKELVASKYSEIKFIDPTISDHITISQSISTSKNSARRKHEIALDTIKEYISQETLPNIEKFHIQLVEYFKNCDFRDNLILYLIPCDSDFNEFEQGLIIDFTDLNNIKIHPSADILTSYKSDEVSQKQLLIKVRGTLLWQIVERFKSWEELSIGFHCRIHRKPDVYNSDFWYHFSNIYIK